MLKSSLVALAAMLAAASASAEAPVTIVGGQPSVRVSYADLDLASAAGRKALEGRVQRAASRLCVDNGVRDLERRMGGRDCIARAVASAAPQIELAVAGHGKAQLPAAKAVTVTFRR